MSKLNMRIHNDHKHITQMENNVSTHQSKPFKSLT